MSTGQLQDPFLNALRKDKVPVSIYLVNGIKLQGLVESFDQFVVLLKNSVSQVVYKHAISTVMPAASVDLIGIAALFEQGDRKRGLQDVFLGAVQRTQNPVTMFLVNGVMLQGDIAAYDLFCLLLQRDDFAQLVYLSLIHI